MLKGHSATVAVLAALVSLLGFGAVALLAGLAGSATNDTTTEYATATPDLDLVRDEPACADVVTAVVADTELLSTANTAIGMWTDVFGCMKFEVVSGPSNVLVHFGDVCWPGERICACARVSTTPMQIFVNPTCWPLTGQNERMLAHELGHMLRYSDLDGNPYMTSSPPRPGTDYRADGVVVCS